MKKLLALLLALIMVFGLAACGKKDPATEEPENTDPATTGEVVADDEFTHTFTQFADARIKIVGSELIKNDYDEDVLRVYYEYTNTSTGDDARGHYPNTAVDFLSVTQDGNDCQKVSFTSMDETAIPEDMNADLYVQPGRTMRNTMCFLCDPNGGVVKVSCYVMVGSWVYEEDKVEPFDFEIDPANLMGAPAPFNLPPITDPTYTDDMDDSGVYGASENEISINGLELTKDDEGVDVVRVKLTVTNNGEDSMSPALLCDLELYQDGIGLPYPTTWDMEEPTAEDEAYEEDLEPGETVECNALYYLRNRNPVEAVIEAPKSETRLGACFDLDELFEAVDKAEQEAAASVSAEEAAARKALVGSWLQRDSDWEDTYTFNADGSGLLVSGPEYPFTYSIKGDILTITYDPEDEEEFTISVDGDVLTMIDMWDEELVLDKQTAQEPESQETETATEPEEEPESESESETVEESLDTFLVGSWSVSGSEYDERFIFESDGTGVYVYSEGGEWEFPFKYTLSNTYVDIRYDDGDVGGFYVENQDEDSFQADTTMGVMELVRE